MIDEILSNLGIVEDVFWTYGGIPMLLGLGAYLSYKSKFFQIRQLPQVFSTFMFFLRQKDDRSKRGVHPIHAFFASVGGCVGIGNVISVCTAVQFGGPGAIFWIWIAAILGMLVKYGEIYLGVKFRIQDDKDSYIGGPMIYLNRVPGGKFLSKMAMVLMCIYGVEVYMFRVITHTVSLEWGIDQMLVIMIMLFLVLGVGQGGVRFVGKVSSIIIPIFLVGYATMVTWVFVKNIHAFPGMIISIFTHAFTPHAAIGAFAGSSVLMSMSHGIRRACYTGDIGIGYAATIHAETEEAVPAKQASLGIVDIILDTFIICTLTLFLIVITGTWHSGISEHVMVAESLAQYFSHIHFIWPIFVFLWVHSSLIAFFVAGRRAAMLLFPKHGSTIFFIFAAMAFGTFSCVGNSMHAMSVMSIVGTLLLMINLYGLFYLRDEVVFNVRGE